MINIKEVIKDLEELENKISTTEHYLHSTCCKALKEIYKLQENYIKKHHQLNFKIIKFYEFDVDECLLIDDNTVEINYFDKCWDCYDSKRITLPIDIIEDNSKIQKWFDTKVDEYENKIKEAKQKKKESEYKKYLELKEKYENNSEKGKNSE